MLLGLSPDIKIPVNIAEYIKEINGFEKNNDLSDENYVIYSTIREYTKEYLKEEKLYETS